LIILNILVKTEKSHMPVRGYYGICDMSLCMLFYCHCLFAWMKLTGLVSVNQL